MVLMVYGTYMQRPMHLYMSAPTKFGQGPTCLGWLYAGQSGNESGVFEDDVTDAGVLVNTFQFSATNILRVVFQVCLC